MHVPVLLGYIGNLKGDTPMNTASVKFGAIFFPKPSVLPGNQIKNQTQAAAHALTCHQEEKAYPVCSLKDSQGTYYIVTMEDVTALQDKLSTTEDTCAQQQIKDDFLLDNIHRIEETLSYKA